MLDPFCAFVSYSFVLLIIGNWYQDGCDKMFFQSNRHLELMPLNKSTLYSVCGVISFPVIINCEFTNKVHKSLNQIISTPLLKSKLFVWNYNLWFQKSTKARTKQAPKDIFLVHYILDGKSECSQNQLN